MFNYLKADFYRIFLKKNLYLYLGAVIGLILMALFISSGSINDESIVMTMFFVFPLFNLFGVSYLFSTVYNDDLVGKTLPSIVGFGKKRTTIILSKMIVITCMMLLSFIVLLASIFALLFALGIHLSADSFSEIFAMVASGMLEAIGFSAVASVIVYGTQKPTISLVSFILLINGLITNLVMMLLVKLELGELAKYLIGPITSQFIMDPTVFTFLPYVIYVTIFIVIATIVFKKRDLEF